MGLFSRLFKVSQAESHALVDKLEDPIKMTEQGIRDFRKDLDNSLKAMAEVKALAIRSRNEINNYRSQAKSFEHKAMQLLQRAESGAMSAEDADRLASEALLKKQENEDNEKRVSADLQKLNANIAKLDANVKKLRSMISKYENELRTLKARARVSKATKKINKSMANIDSSSTVNMLERMKDKVEKDEALSEAYGDIANENKSLDDEIDDALKGEPKAQDRDDIQ